jgi:hypothetical protein
LFEHDLFGKPLHTFPDHALARLYPVAELREAIGTSKLYDKPVDG